MESKGQPTPARVYQDFEPSMEWVSEDDSDTLLVYLPGFAKEQLRVQLRSRNLIISGERKLQQNTWSRFRVEVPVSANCDLNKISAKFEQSILFVRQAKLITPTSKPEENKPQTVAAAPVPTPQKPADESNVAPKAELKEKNDSTTTNNNHNVAEDEKEGKTEGKDDDKKTTEDAGENASAEKEKSERESENKKAVVYGELDKTTRTALDKYKRAAGVFGRKVKTSTNAVNAIVILLVGLVIGIFVSNSIKSWSKA